MIPTPTQVTNEANLALFMRGLLLSEPSGVDAPRSASHTKSLPPRLRQRPLLLTARWAKP